ncbi:MAG TPA: NUDIX domain-containing protein [Spirochaetia bacterium]|nr:NUDIX domain-containing protein [Spirochaetia bacterium]
MKRYSFCPVCGVRYADTARVDESLLECAACGFLFWQNSKPAVGAIVTRARDGITEVLLTRRGVPPHRGSWDLPGGFLSNGEHPELGVARELREELQVASVRNLRLVGTGIVEYRRDDQAEEARFALPMYYRCEIDTDRLTASDDVAEVRWYPLEHLPPDMAFPSDVAALAAFARSLAEEA